MVLTSQFRLLLALFSLAFVLSLLGCASKGEINQLRLGVWAAEHDLWDEAIFRWQKALEKEPNSAYLYNNLAVAYEKKGLWEKAKEAYETALKLAPKNKYKYIEANYKYFQEHLKALKKPERKEEKKEEREGIKKTSQQRSLSEDQNRGSPPLSKSSEN